MQDLNAALYNEGVKSGALSFATIIPLQLNKAHERIIDPIF